MPTKEDPNNLADAIVRAAKAEAEQGREKNATGAPIWLRVKGLSSLPKRTQDHVVREALAQVRRSVLARAISVAWGLACFIGWQMAAQVASSAAYAAVLAAGLGVATIYTVAARREIRAMLRHAALVSRGAA